MRKRQSCCHHLVYCVAHLSFLTRVIVCSSFPWRCSASRTRGHVYRACSTNSAPSHHISMSDAIRNCLSVPAGAAGRNRVHNVSLFFLLCMWGRRGCFSDLFIMSLNFLYLRTRAIVCSFFSMALSQSAIVIASSVYWIIPRTLTKAFCVPCGRAFTPWGLLPFFKTTEVSRTMLMRGHNRFRERRHHWTCAVSEW